MNGAVRIIDADSTRIIDDVDNPRRLIRAGLIAVVALAGAFAVWAAIAPMSGAAIAPAVVKVDMNRKVVQHQEGGIVGEILVREGSKVRAGDTLIVLKDVRVDASRELAQTQLHAELAKAARLSAEQSWAASITFPDEVRARSDDPRIAELLQREEALFKERRRSYYSLLGLIGRQIAETRSEIRARDGQVAADHSAASLQREELAANKALLAEGGVSKARLLTLERNLAEIEGRIGDSQAERARALQKQSDLQLRAEELRTKMMQEAATEL